MFGVINDEFPVSFRKRTVSRNHRQVFVGLGAQHFLHVQQPCFAVNGDHRGFRIEQQAHLLIFFDGNAFAAGGTKSGESRIFEASCAWLPRKTRCL